MDGESIVIFGNSGYGKTFLCEAAADVLRSHGVETLRVRASAGGRTTALAALRERIEADEARSNPVETGDPTATPDDGARGRLVIQVDDAHLLDTASAELLGQLASDKTAVLLLTSEPLPTQGHSDSRHSSVFALNDLWIAGHADRVDLDPLTAAESVELIAEMAPEHFFDVVTTATIYERSGGSPLLIRELIAEALRGPLLLEERDSLSPRITAPSGRILDLIGHQLRVLAPAELHALALLGRFSGLSYAHALLIFPPLALRKLLHLGFLVRRDQGEDRIVAHKLMAEAAFSLTDPAGWQPMVTTLTAALMRDRALGRPLRPAECVIIAEQWTSHGDLAPVVAEWGVDAVSDVLLRGSRKCSSAGVHADALGFARQAHELTPTVVSAIEYSRALAHLKRFGQALIVLQAGEAHIETVDDACKILRWWSNLADQMPGTPPAFDQVEDRAAHWFVGDEVMAGELKLMHFVNISRTTDRTALVELGRDIATTESYSAFARIRAASLAGFEIASRGNLAEGIALLDLGENLAGPSAGSDELASTHGDIALDVFTRLSSVRCMGGIDVDIVSAELAVQVTTAIELQEYGALWQCGLVAAMLAQFRGDWPAAVAELTMVEMRVSRSDDAGWLPWIQMLLASALAHAGESDAAQAKVRTANGSVATVGPNEWLRYLLDWTTVDILTLTRKLASARAMADKLAVDPTVGGPLIEAWLLYTQIRTGTATDEVLDDLDSVVAQTDIPFLKASAQRVRAVVERNAKELDRVAENLAKLGAFGEASDISQQAAQIHVEQGERGAAAQSRSRSQSYAGAVRGTLEWPEAESTRSTDRLTEREREVAILAARGNTNRDIARTLYLSVRTVESHLYQARVKLGAPSRRDLAAILGLERGLPTIGTSPDSATKPSGVA